MAQNVKHPRLNAGRTVDLRCAAALQEIGGPFESIAHSVEMRSIAGPAGQGNRRGKFNLFNVGIFVWRLRSYSTGYRALDLAQTLPASPPAGAYTFNPFGIDTPLFNRLRTTVDPASPADPLDLPIPLTRALFAVDLNNLRTAIAGAASPPNARPRNSDYYGPTAACASLEMVP